MRPQALVGIVLLVLGAFICSAGMSYKSKDEVLKVGDLKASVDAEARGAHLGRRRRHRGGPRASGRRDEAPRLIPLASVSYQRIYAVVRRIPEGRVATYGQIAVACRSRRPRPAGRVCAPRPARKAPPFPGTGW